MNGLHVPPAPGIGWACPSHHHNQGLRLRWTPRRGPIARALGMRKRAASRRGRGGGGGVRWPPPPWWGPSRPLGPLRHTSLTTCCSLSHTFRHLIFFAARPHFTGLVPLPANPSGVCPTTPPPSTAAPSRPPRSLLDLSNSSNRERAVMRQGLRLPQIKCTRLREVRHKVGPIGPMG